MRRCTICESPILNRKRDALTCSKACGRIASNQRVMNNYHGRETTWERLGPESPSVRARRYKLGRYGLDKVQAQDLLDEPEGFCNACGSYEKLTVDHDHNHCPNKIGCVICLRGFLCDSCNVALGRVKDSIKTLENLIIYLKETQK